MILVPRLVKWHSVSCDGHIMVLLLMQQHLKIARVGCNDYSEHGHSYLHRMNEYYYLVLFL